VIVGVPKEIKSNENRVAVTPAGVETLVGQGHTVMVERSAGAGSGFEDALYEKSGAKISSAAEEIFAKAEMIVKVKEPLPVEYGLIRRGQIVFTYFHFASSRELTEGMINSGCVAIAYETVQKANGELPLLTPMSEVAGRMAVQEGAKFLEESTGGRGILLGGVPGVAPANVVILGGGIVGMNAAKMAAGLGAVVTILDISLDRLRYLDDIMPKNVLTLASNAHNIRESIKTADLVVGAVLIPGAKAPNLVTRDMLKLMKKRSVIVDVAVDQGGCVETCHPTTHENPTYVVDDVVHYCVANMPGAVPFTSTLALTNATLPYAVHIANEGYVKAAEENREILLGLNVIGGKVVYKGVAEAFGLPYVHVEQVLR